MRADPTARIAFLEHEAAFGPVARKGAAEFLNHSFTIQSTHRAGIDAETAIRRAYIVGGEGIPLELDIKQDRAYLDHVAEPLIDEERVPAEAAQACKLAGMPER
jgi:hypothetical protein